MSDPASERATQLWSLVEQRALPGADVEAIDAEIWEAFGVTRAVVFTDLAGFSRQVARFGILHFLQVIFEMKRLLLPLVERHGGTLVKVEADSMLLLFPEAGQALACSIEMQRACQAFNPQRAPEEHVVLCCGLGVGRVLEIGDVDVFGHEVNLASKLGEDTADNDEILVTEAAHGVLASHPGVTWHKLDVEYAGERTCWRADYR